MSKKKPKKKMIAHADPTMSGANFATGGSVRLGAVTPDDLDRYARTLRSHATAMEALADAVRECESIGTGPVVIDGKTKPTRADSLLKEFLLNGHIAVMKAKARIE